MLPSEMNISIFSAHVTEHRSVGQVLSLNLSLLFSHYLFFSVVFFFIQIPVNEPSGTPRVAIRQYDTSITALIVRRLGEEKSEKNSPSGYRPPRHPRRTRALFATTNKYPTTKRRPVSGGAVKDFHRWSCLRKAAARIILWKPRAISTENPRPPAK